MEFILEEQYNLSIGKIILLFYLLVSSTSLFPLLSKQWKKELENNRIAQHILGITTMMALVILISNGKFSTLRIILYTFLGYLWFIMATKLDLQWSIIIIVLLLGYYLYTNIAENKDIQIINDKILSNDEKIILTKENKYNNAYAIGIIILVTICGTILYSEKKEDQYGGGYNLINFLIY